MGRCVAQRKFLLYVSTRRSTKPTRRGCVHIYAPLMSEQPDGATADQIARWMLDQVAERGGLYQDRAVHHIIREFGLEWSYVNANGNRAIDKRILAAFRDLSEHDVIWNRGARAWRKRRAHHREGRLQD